MDDYNKIYIDPDEPLNSLLNKIQTDVKDKLVIIIHKQSSIFTGQVNIELIKTYAERVEKELIFITNIRKIKNILSRAGFNVYADLEEFETGSQKEEEAENAAKEKLLANQEYSNAKVKSKKNLGKKIFMVLATCLLMGLTWFYFIFPTITVEVAPIIKDKVLVSKIKAMSDLETIDWSQKSLPLIEKEVNLEEGIEIKTSGKRRIGISQATGVLTLINNNRKRVTIPRGTKVSTSNGIKFKTIDKVTIPPAKVERFMDMVVGVKAGRTEVNIEAVNKGTKGNVSKARVVKFVNHSYPVKIINPEPTTGGKNDIVSVVTKEDIKEALDKAKNDLAVKAKEKLSNKFDSDLVFFKNNIKFGNQILQAKNEVGDITESLEVIGKIKVTGFAVEKEGLKNLIFKLYQQSLTDKFKLKEPQITIKDIQLKQINAKEASLSIKSVGQVIGQVDSQAIMEQIVGKKVKNARGVFDNMSEIANYRIDPANQVNLPQFKFGINLVIKEPVKE